MKRILYFIFVFILAVFFSIVVIATEESTTALDTGYEDILFANNYRGFCLDRDLHGAYPDYEFSINNTDEAISNYDGSNISQALKILFTQHFETIFVTDEHGNYIIENSNTVQGVVWHFTENQYVWGVQKTLVESIKSYSGPTIPDDGYQLTLSNGDIITFSFMVLKPKIDNVQYFFAYKFTVGQEAPHTHNFGDTWQSNEDIHWKQCECEETADIATHSGGIANCISSAICSTCLQPYGGVDSENHTGNTDLRGFLPATQDAPGYTGDTYCTDCNTLLTSGEPIPQLHTHNFGDTWQSNEDIHWKQCECEEETDIEKHIYEDSICKICGRKYPDFPPIESPNTGDNFNSHLSLTLLFLIVSSLFIFKKAEIKT